MAHSTPAHPASRASRNACSKAPGDGAAVAGMSGPVMTRSQNSLLDSSSRSTSSSAPKRIVSGTTRTSRSSVVAGIRSQALSVTTWMLAIGSSLVRGIGQGTVGRCAGCPRVLRPCGCPSDRVCYTPGSSSCGAPARGPGCGPRHRGAQRGTPRRGKGLGPQGCAGRLRAGAPAGTWCSNPAPERAVTASSSATAAGTAAAGTAACRDRGCRRPDARPVGAVDATLGKTTGSRDVGPAPGAGAEGRRDPGPHRGLGPRDVAAQHGRHHQRALASGTSAQGPSQDLPPEALDAVRT